MYIRHLWQINGNIERKLLMKTRKLNRGLLLGGTLLVGLAGFVVFDYFNFKSNKSDIEDAVKTYLNDAAKASISSDGNCKEAWEKVIDDNWGYNEFYSKNFMFHYVTANSLKDQVNNMTENELAKGHLTDCTVNIRDIKVSKTGPNLAQAVVEYSLSFEGTGLAQILDIDGVTDCVLDSSNYQFEYSNSVDDNVFKDLQYKGQIDYVNDATFYLEFEGGKWKLVGVQGGYNEFSLTNENGDDLDLEKIAKGERGAVKEDKKDTGADKAVKIQLPDGTVVDVPEGEDISDLKDLPDGAKIITGDDSADSSNDTSSGDLSKLDVDKSEQMPEVSKQDDDTSMPEPETGEGITPDSKAGSDGELLAAMKLRGWR